MIRATKTTDIDTVCNIVNENWKNVYAGYVNPELLSDTGCQKRAYRLKADITSGRLSEYVWEEQNQIAAMLSFGGTADTDKAGAFEIWRIYITSAFQGMGIGHALLTFAEQRAKEQSYREIVIWAFKENIHAVSFYQKHGYSIDKECYLSEPYFAAGVRLCKRI